MNSAIYNSYLTGDERLQAIEEAEIDNQFNKFNIMLEMVNLRLKQNIADAELKVFKESGTYDDFEYLCEEAEAEASEQKQNIFQTIINAILGLFSKIGNKIKELFKIKGNPEDEVEVDKTDVDNHNAIVNWWRTTKSGFSSIANGNWAVGLKTIFDGVKWPVLIAGSAAGATAGAVHLIKIKRSNLDNMVQNFDQTKTETESIFKTISDKLTSWFKPDNKEKKPDDESEGSSFLNDFKSKLLNPIVKIITNFGKALGKGAEAVKDGVENAVQTAKDKIDEHKAKKDEKAKSEQDEALKKKYQGNHYSQEVKDIDLKIKQTEDKLRISADDKNLQKQLSDELTELKRKRSSLVNDDGSEMDDNRKKSEAKRRIRELEDQLKIANKKYVPDIQKKIEAAKAEFSKKYNEEYTESVDDDLVFGIDLSSFMESNTYDEDLELSELADMFNSL